jgi:hypothetical protein
MIQQFFLWDIVPKTDGGENVIQRSFGHDLVVRHRQVVFTDICPFPQANVAAFLPECFVIERMEQLDDFAPANLRKPGHG